MITIRTGNYSDEEKEMIFDVSQSAIGNICAYCGCEDYSICWTNKCQYRHIIDDLSRVSARFEPYYLSHYYITSNKAQTLNP